MTASAPGDAPYVSVIVPVYNGQDEIGACVEALLAQTLDKSELEVIVVDNGSTDGTCDVVTRYPVRLVHENAAVGSYAARNRGIQAARGRILGFTDADCVPDPDWVRAACEAFDDPAVCAVGAQVVPAAPASEVEAYLARRGSLSPRHSQRHRFRPYFPTAGVFYRREVFERVGSFNADLISGGDADLCWRAIGAGCGDVRYASNAVVEHRHRSDVREMRRQRFKWGLGAGCLSRLYRREMGGIRHRIALQGYVDIAASVVRWLAALPGALLRGSEGRRAARWRWWDLTNFVCWKAGYLVGALRPQAVRKARL